jgi:hypothetical protein
MVHDVEPAWVRRKAFLSAFMRAILKLTTAYVFLNKSSQQIFYRKNPHELVKPFCLAPHSQFQTILFGDAKVREHRKAYGVEDTDILISVLGDITPNKGLRHAALLPTITKSGCTVKLAVCGAVDKVLPHNYVDSILQLRSSQHHIRVPDRLPDEELALWIQSSDAVFLSYTSGSNSGMAFAPRRRSPVQPFRAPFKTMM